MPEYVLVITDMSKHFSFGLKGIALKASGEYYIALDKSLSGDQLDMVYKHELSHILLGHLDKEVPIAIREQEADDYGGRMDEQEYQELQRFCASVMHL